MINHFKASSLCIESRSHSYSTCIIGILMLATSLCDAATTIYVSPNGNDEGAGTFGNPFASLHRASDEILAIKQAQGLPEGGIIVEILGGYYQHDQTLSLTSGHSGTSASPISFRSYNDEEVIITGGQEVSGFELVQDAEELLRLPSVARGNTYVADLADSGITDYGVVSESVVVHPTNWPAASGGNRLEMFFDSKPMTLARWPNSAWANISGVANKSIGNVVYEGDRPTLWVNESDPWLYGYWYNDWSSDYQQVQSIATASTTIKLSEPYFRYGYRAGQPYYALNLLIELDSAGEWYLDRETGYLYFWPPGPIEDGSPTISMTSTLLEMNNASHITITGLIFEASRGTAINIAGGIGNSIANSSIRNTGKLGIEISEGYAHKIVNSNIYGTGDGGIKIIAGDRTTLTAGGHLIKNNRIHDFARWSKVYQPGIYVGGVGNHIAHNLIYDAPHQAIYFMGNDHIIEYNEIYNVVMQSNDAGAIYSGSDWSYRGTVLRYNYLHDINGLNGNGGSGIYLDDMLSGTIVFGNIFSNVTRPIIIGGGRSNSIENNVFVGYRDAIHLDDRGLTWAAGSVATGWPYRLELMPYQKEPWSTRYPTLPHILGDEPGAPKYNSFTCNITWKGGRLIWSTPGADPYIEPTNNLLNQDPLFVNESNKDFSLQYDSPALALGCVNIPFSFIGLLPLDHNPPSSPTILEPLEVY